MRFTTALVAGAFATLASAQSSTAGAVSPAQASQLACLEDCPLGDTKCQSYCISVPSPNEKQVEETTKCAMECDQGDGSPSDTEKYAACQQKCIADYYWKSVDGTPRETEAASNDNDAAETSVTRASVTTTVSDAKVTDTVTKSGSSDQAAETDESSADSADSTDSETSSGTATGTAAESTETDSGASALVGGSIFCLFAAALAL